MQPSQVTYVCENNINSQIYSTASEAINETYNKKVFNMETRFPGPSVMVDNFSTFISNLEITSSKKNKTIQFGYQASVTSKFRGQQSNYNEISPNKVWKKTGILKKYSGETLFGINHSRFIRHNSEFVKNPIEIKQTELENEVRNEMNVKGEKKGIKAMKTAIITCTTAGTSPTVIQKIQ
ncbi:hypothetical protein Glove_853g1 [Diversispora epigaea]|uniref:Uncharacterized protein n=1 Tax=Diversispora epigaea TaxID=1348612 RepID=A0A397G1T9_9GLOM|nr:hypothetical protein Glove_853g1 [Diversispora epigaea]